MACDLRVEKPRHLSKNQLLLKTKAGEIPQKNQLVS